MLNNFCLTVLSYNISTYEFGGTNFICIIGEIMIPSNKEQSPKSKLSKRKCVNVVFCYQC